jgi:flagellar biosynthetic protein FliQ
MTAEFVISIARKALETMLTVSLPILLTSLVIGVSISVFQAITQIQEMTLTFVPKVVATFVALLVFGSWMITKMVDLTKEIYQNIPNWVR